MKKQIAAIIVLLTFFLVISAVSVSAQTNQKITVEIPFRFIVVGDQYEAGQYVIEQLDAQKDPFMMTLSGANIAEKKVFITQSLQAETPVENVQIVFSQYDEDTYFLSEIWTGNTKDGLVIPMGRIERKLERFMKKTKQKVEIKASLQ
ncbi:MAG TPA: hypothetical protein VNB22_23445 [Pyrinomonadaceae bacterium]|nr:hypothetical protein [Pyrinomonadaceae bacterium]